MPPPSPRRAKLIVRDIREVRTADAGFKAGFLGETVLVDTGLVFVVKGVGSIFRGIEWVEWSRSLDWISCSLSRVTDLAESRSCRLDAWTSGSLSLFFGLVGFRT